MCLLWEVHWWYFPWERICCPLQGQSRQEGGWHHFRGMEWWEIDMNLFFWVDDWFNCTLRNLSFLVVIVLVDNLDVDSAIDFHIGDGVELCQGADQIDDSLVNLWHNDDVNTLSSYLSQVFEPSPQGLFLMVIFKCLVGILTGPLTSMPGFSTWASLARETNSFEVLSMFFTLREVMVILIFCWVCFSYSLVPFLSPSMQWNFKNFNLYLKNSKFNKHLSASRSSLSCPFPLRLLSRLPQEPNQLRRLRRHALVNQTTIFIAWGTKLLMWNLSIHSTINENRLTKLPKNIKNIEKPNRRHQRDQIVCR